MGRVQVDVVRRSAHRPVPHPESMRLEADNEPQRRRFLDWVGTIPTEVRTVADLFCGAGGMSLGLEDAGFRTIVGVDSDEWALETHRSHHGGLHLDWDLGDAEVVHRLGTLLRDAAVDVVAGGPPCQPFSRAGRSLIRKLEAEGRRGPDDARRDLWESFLRIAFLARPSAVLMENVPGMATEEDMEILRLMVDRLEARGYGVSARVVDSNSMGVPQHRRRLIMVALRHGARFRFPEPQLDHSGRDHWLAYPTIWDAIGDLPAVKAGWSVDGVHDADGASDYAPRDGVGGGRLVQHLRSGATDGVVHDHFTRSVREDDEQIFRSMRPETRYDEIDEDLRRYRDDIFTDKYKRLDQAEPSRTITAHLARDGYWYIHPREDRTLTVREAARIQTFPDRFRFAGPPTSMFRQIGNAVPPLLAERLGLSLRQQLDEPAARDVSTIEHASALAGWWRDGGVTDDQPDWLTGWLRGTAWQVLLGELLLKDLAPAHLRFLVPMAVDSGGRLSTPQQFLNTAALVRSPDPMGPGADSRTHPLLELAGFDVALDVASEAMEDPSVLGDDTRLADLGVPPSVRSVLRLRHPGPDDDPVLTSSGLRRVVARVAGIAEDDVRGVASRIGVMRLVGVVDIDPDPLEDGHEDDYDGAPEPMTGSGDAGAAHTALLVISRLLCRPKIRHCAQCPLVDTCATAQYEPFQAPLELQEAS